jgi:uncharacterized protein
VKTASDLVREARLRAGMTQAALAEAADITQSVVSAYESGRREPSFAQLGRLIAASGNRLVAEVAPGTRDRLDQVRARAAELQAALRPLGAKGISVFGSVARRTDRPGSDVDLLIDLDDEVGIFGLLQMQSLAEKILGGRVDLVPSRGLKSDAADSILADAVPL